MLNQATSFTGIWDEKHLKALLGMRRFPITMIQVEPWRGWIEQRGGLKSVIEHLRAAPLSTSQKQLLEIILANPNASSIFYADKLHISQSPYFARLSDLIEGLLVEMDTWPVEAASQKQGNLLPSVLTPLVGAEQSVALAAAILERPGARLLTLTGPGGVGKTRLAIAVGTQLLENFRDGVFFISLETINDAALLPSQIARLLNVETVATQPLLKVLKTYMRERQILLVLDNFEQLVDDGAQFVTDLLQAAGQLKIMVTSREALNVYGEYRFTVPELPHPQVGNLSSLAQLNEWPAVQLFVQRVQARHPDFVLTESNKNAVVAICNQLDGLPLAIELAAAQIKLLSADQALPQLESGLKSLKDTSRDRPLRQKTLWDAIDWSYQLLSDAEKTLFSRLSVFGREWSLEAASAVCQVSEIADNLNGLVDKSLLHYAAQSETGELRFQMLQAVREYALEQLHNRGETGQMQHRHASHYLGFVLEAEAFIAAPKQLIWMRRFEKELENLQIALQWMLDEEETEMAFNLLGAGWRFYHMLNIWSEARLWMERVLKQGAHLKSLAHARTLWGAGWLAIYQGDNVKALKMAEKGLQLARELGDRRLVGLLLQNLSNGFCRRKEYDKAALVLEESLSIFRTLGDQEETAWVFGHLAGLASLRGDLHKSREMLECALVIFRAIHHHWAIAHLLRSLALRLLQLQDFEQAKIVLDESIIASQQVGDKLGIGWTLHLRGRLALEYVDTVIARELFEKAQVIFEESSDQNAIRHNQEFMERLVLLENKK